MSAAAAPQAKGSTLRATLAYVEKEFGEPARATVLARLPDDVRRRVEASATPADEVPIELLRELWGAVDAVIGARDPRWPERSGAFSIDSSGVRLYGGILLKSSPEEFLTQRVSLFRLFYHPGNMEVVAQEDGHAVLRLVGFPGDPVFCRRQTGGLLRSVELAGGANPSVRHVRCAVEGDAFCEWELRWE
ncbi:MAG TPA: hypothetical protein VHG91_10495 [Longimicrobium sp.]|nr:hypothetical protein [Longimicrobium sp.]